MNFLKSTFIIICFLLCTEVLADAPQFLNAPADITLECDEEIPYFNFPEYDDGGLPTTETFTEEIINDQNFCDYIVIRTWTISNADGQASISTTINSIDTTAPIFTFVSLEGANAEDNCSEVTITFEDVDEFRVYTATDECGNQTQAEVSLCAGTPIILPTSTIDLNEEPLSLFSIPDIEITNDCPGLFEVSLAPEIDAVQDAIDNVSNPLCIDCYYNRIQAFSGNNSDEYTAPVKKRNGVASFLVDNTSIDFEQVVLIDGLSTPVLTASFNSPQEVPCPFEDENLCNLFTLSYTDQLIAGGCEEGLEIMKRTWSIVNVQNEEFLFQQIFQLDLGPDLDITIEPFSTRILEYTCETPEPQTPETSGGCCAETNELEWTWTMSMSVSEDFEPYVIYEFEHQATDICGNSATEIEEVKVLAIPRHVVLDSDEFNEVAYDNCIEALNNPETEWDDLRTCFNAIYNQDTADFSCLNGVEEDSNDHCCFTEYDDTIWLSIDGSAQPVRRLVSRFAHFTIENTYQTAFEQYLVYVDPNLSSCSAMDFDNNGFVGSSDLIEFLSSFGCGFSCSQYDFNGSNSVNVADLIFFLSFYGLSCE